MTRPTARVLALLEILQSGGTRTVAQLAARLDVDERTVRRYVEHLRDLDVPVRTVRGRHGGYRLAPGFRLPPLMFTDDEAVAVVLGLVTARRSGAAGTPAAADAATAKVRRVLPQVLGDRVDALLGTAEFTTPARPAVAPEARVLLLMAGAARDRRPVAIGYTDRDGRTGERTVEPYGIVAHAGRWYVTAADVTGGPVRTFRLDRIVAPAVRPGTFDVPDGFDPAAHVRTGLARTPWRHEVSVLVEGSAEQVRALLPAGLATVDDADGGARLTLRAQELGWVPALLAGLDLPFTVEGPDALRDEVRALARRLDAAAGTTQAVRPAAAVIPPGAGN